MGEIVDLEQLRAGKKLSPLARTLYRLVGACRRLVEKQPKDPDLAEIRECLNRFDKEVDHE